MSASSVEHSGRPLHTHTHTHTHPHTLTPSHPLRIFIEKLPKHPEYGKALPAEKARNKQLLKEALPRAMELKEKLRALYEEEKEALLEKIAIEVCARTHTLSGYISRSAE